MKKYLPLLIANFLITPTLLADYSVRIPLEQNMFAEPENLTLDGNVTANKTSVNFGESLSISWDYEKLTSIFIPNAGTFNSNSGSVNVAPNKSGAINVIVNNRSKSETVSLPMNVIFPPVDIVSFTSSVRGITVGEKVNLSWQVDNADYVEISLISNNNASVPVGRQPNTGSFVSNAGGLVTGDIISYLMTAYSLDGESIKTATVSVPVRGNMTLTAFSITNPFVSGLPDGSGGIAIPVGGTLNATWSGTNIKTLVLSGSDTSNPNGTLTFTKSMPNPDVNSYNIPMNTVGDWNIKSVVGTGYNGYQITPYVGFRLRVYQPTQLSSFTINGLSDSEVTLKKGKTYPITWASNSPLVQYVYTGIYGDSPLASNERATAQYFGDVGNYRIKIATIDYNGVSDMKEILVHIIN